MADPRPQIFIVDDTSENIQVLGDMLDEAGYVVRIATSGPEALESIEASPPDLILLDILMPDMDGFEVCRLLKANPRLQAIPVIFISALDQTERKVDGFRVGAVDYIAKPFYRSEVLARVNTHLQLVQASALKSEIQRRIALENVLRNKNAEIECLTYSLSHDLRSPLVTIQCYLGELLEEAQTSGSGGPITTYQKIMDATGQMAVVIHDLLKISRLGLGLAPPKAIDMNQLFHQQLHDFSNIIASRGVNVILAPKLPSISGDEASMGLVLHKLLENAFKFMGGQNAPQIEMGYRKLENGNAFYLRDKGIGIEAKHHKQIFGVFNKLNKNSEGSGTGLALVQRIISLHGGLAWVESEGLGMGSTFWFSLPRSVTGYAT
jgi:DNA-binding response OmpR family regulator